MKKVISVLTLFILSVASSGVQAVTINGSFGVTGVLSTDVDIALNPLDTLADVTEITLVNVGGTGLSDGNTDDVLISSYYGAPNLGEGPGATLLQLTPGVIDVSGFLTIEGWSLKLTSINTAEQNVGKILLSGTGLLTGSRNGVDYDPTPAIWTFSTTDLGDWDGADLRDGTYSMSVQTTVVPVPAAVWLFGSGMIGLVGIARRKAK
jgi:hypothetical protein